MCIYIGTGNWFLAASPNPGNRTQTRAIERQQQRARQPDKLCTLLKGLAYNQDSAFYAALNIHDGLTLHRFPGAARIAKEAGHRLTMPQPIHDAVAIRFERNRKISMLSPIEIARTEI